MTDQQNSKGMKLAPGVVETIISIVASEVEGVANVGTHPPTGLKAIFQSNPFDNGIEAEFIGDKLAVGIHLDAYYGFVLPDLAEEVREAVAQALQVQIGIEVARVDIYVDGIEFDKD